jgi:hypothetical protein
MILNMELQLYNSPILNRKKLEYLSSSPVKSSNYQTLLIFQPNHARNAVDSVRQRHRQDDCAAAGDVATTQSQGQQVQNGTLPG